MRNDRLSALEQWDLSEDDAMRNEVVRGRDTIASGETLAGAARFAAGAGRHGDALARLTDWRAVTSPAGLTPVACGGCRV